MAVSSDDVGRCFEKFWDFVAACERNYRTEGHTGFYPPDMVGDFCIAEFHDVYDQIHPWLKKFHKRRMFSLPVCLRHHPGPITAETGHQALLFFLNPPEALHGELGVLDSAEYLEMKKIACDELAYAQRQWQAAQKRPKPSVEAQTRAKLVELRSVIYDHHFPKKAPFRQATLKAEKIAEKLGWSQSTVSRLMSQLFKTPSRGMAAYHAIFKTMDVPKGYREKLDDRTDHVVAIWHDPKIESKKDDTEQPDRPVRGTSCC